MTDRTEVQGMLRELREQQDAQRNQNEARAAVSGETKEQQIAEQQGLNKAFADSVANIASNSSMLKDGLLNGYDNSMRQYYEDKRAHNTAMGQIAQNASNQWAQAANNGVSLMAGSAQTLAGAVGDLPINTNRSNSVSASEQQAINNKLADIGQSVKIQHGLNKTPSWDDFTKQVRQSTGIGAVRVPYGYYYK